ALLTADLPRVDDGHDDRVARTLLGDLGLPGRRSGRVEDVLAHPAADRIVGHDVATFLEGLGVHLAQDEELEPVDLRILAGRDQAPPHLRKEHRYLPPRSLSSFSTSPLRPSGSTRSTLMCGRAMMWVVTISPTRAAPL